MRTRSNLSFAPLAALLCVTVTVAGCAQPASESKTAGGGSSAEVHEHPSKGPHGGVLVELGNEQYHAELVHDKEAGSVIVYVLDSAAKAAVPIDASEVTINLSHDGEAEQFTLTASPESGEDAGKSSKFTSTEAELATELDHDHVEAQVVVSVDGKQYRGKVSHAHEGDDHDHDH